MRVEVRNDNMDQAIRVLKKKLQQDGLFNELREREYYSTRSEKRRRSKAAAIRRQKREAVKRELEESGNV
jgi:small subunit ribosomal protein S21